ncbi:sensor histidine kinase [Romboutsia weinsteinii]|uniref:histidine kinase n=1 Tax=Romboutsia weinsteinii TaxID=2020949 RepID=A0A371J3B0_9FIRM|nr:HAMP domain-containing sensor histidine kinase [Romboutsia weinsteinii]RDY27193.1 sensor histidine kinase [Romboutsia weinsteinii]
MGTNIYKTMIENSNMAYCEVKGIKNSNGDYIDLIITDTNEALKRYIINYEMNILNQSINHIFSGTLDWDNINNTLKESIEGNSCTLNQYCNMLNEYWTIDIYSIGDDMFALIMSKSEKKNIEEGLNKLRMDFFANISHELRTPINIILSSLQLFKLKTKELDKGDVSHLSRYIKLIEQNGFRLLKLANNLIDTTKLDSGYLEYKPQNGDIVSFVESICSSVAEFIGNKNMNIIFDTDEEEKVIAFDQDKIERIILNLISNAIKFNSKNGTIDVNIKCGDYIKISVKDEGIGIPRNKLSSIFNRFEQIANSDRDEREGSGIGLSLVKSLAEIHGGSIEVKSTFGEGSEFIISIPDRLVDTDEAINSDDAFLSNQIHRMSVEFSDIYI